MFTRLGLHHDLSFVHAELTLAVNPYLAQFRDDAAASLTTAHQTMRALANPTGSVRTADAA